MKKSGVFQRKIYFVIIQDDIRLCYAEDVESVSFQFAGKLMFPGVFQDGGEIPEYLLLGRECDYGVETNWKALTWQEPDGSTERM